VCKKLNQNNFLEKSWGIKTMFLFPIVKNNIVKNNIVKNNIVKNNIVKNNIVKNNIVIFNFNQKPAS
jgi:hypothetical protein